MHFQMLRANFKSNMDGHWKPKITTFQASYMLFNNNFVSIPTHISSFDRSQSSQWGQIESLLHLLIAFSRNATINHKLWIRKLIYYVHSVLLFKFWRIRIEFSPLLIVNFLLAARECLLIVATFVKPLF